MPLESLLLDKGLPPPDAAQAPDGSSRGNRPGPGTRKHHAARCSRTSQPGGFRPRALPPGGSKVRSSKQTAAIRARAGALLGKPMFAGRRQGRPGQTPTRRAPSASTPLGAPLCGPLSRLYLKSASRRIPEASNRQNSTRQDPRPRVSAEAEKQGQRPRRQPHDVSCRDPGSTCKHPTEFWRPTGLDARPAFTTSQLFNPGLKFLPGKRGNHKSF